MADAPDREDRTEEPTEKRLLDAIEHGRAAFSREAPMFASLSATLAAILFVLPGRAQALFTRLIGVIDDPGGWRIENEGDALSLVGRLAVVGIDFLLPISALMIGASLVASFAQAAPRFVPERILLDFSRLSPRAGFHRLFGMRGGIEYLKSLVKLGAVAFATGMMLIGQKVVLLTAMEDDPGALPERILGLAAKTVAAVLVATVVIASADLVWSRILWRRDNRMSRHEVKEELRQAEGDRMVKARLRSLRMDRSRRRMLSAVPKATMVVANPTHYAVAMRYVRGETAAPLVLAKGADLIALKIRAIAEAHDIPVIEDKPLARSLHGAVEIERPIPAQFYYAVAEIVRAIQQRKGGWAPRRQ